VFQKREGRYVNFEGNYTWSKNTDDSSVGPNNFIGTLGNGFPQELDHLKAEWSASANDATIGSWWRVCFSCPLAAEL